MKVIDQLCSVILGAFAVLTAYKTAYVVLGFLLRAKRYPAAAQRKHYGATNPPSSATCSTASGRRPIRQTR